MSAFGNGNRRSFLAIAAACLCSARLSRIVAKQTPATASAPVPSRIRSRRYSVQATVMLGSIPLFTKSGVGGALLTLEESGTPEYGAIALQFGAGTWPDRLKGFNRFGATQEIVRLDHGHLAESSYYAIMTSSREANLSQAEQAFRSPTHSLLLTVGSGTSTAAGCSARVEHKAVPAACSWSDCPQLMRELREQKSPPLRASPAVAAPSAQGVSCPLCAARQQPVLPTFLYAVRQAILSGRSDASARYTHNGEIYTLTTQSHMANRSTQTAITARICRDDSHAQSEFRVWMASDSDSELPLRIEFRAKTYLKLTLELDERQTIPVFKPILAETES